MKVCVVLVALFGVSLAAVDNCLRICPFSYIPVCASDGKTYSNVCAMHVAECLQGTTLTVARSGPCEVVPVAVRQLEATEQPVVTQPHCLMMCPMIWFPVCGSDGKTYGNECEMKVRSCMTKMTITRVKQGPC